MIVAAHTTQHRRLLQRPSAPNKHPALAAQRREECAPCKCRLRCICVGCLRVCVCVSPHLSVARVRVGHVLPHVHRHHAHSHAVRHHRRHLQQWVPGLHGIAGRHRGHGHVVVCSSVLGHVVFLLIFTLLCRALRRLTFLAGRGPTGQHRGHVVARATRHKSVDSRHTLQGKTITVTHTPQFAQVPMTPHSCTSTSPAALCKSAHSCDPTLCSVIGLMYCCACRQAQCCSPVGSG